MFIPFNVGATRQCWSATWSFLTGRPYLYTNKKATVQKCTVAKKTQKVKTFNGLQAHFEMDAIFDYV